MLRHAARLRYWGSSVSSMQRHVSQMPPAAVMYSGNTGAARAERKARRGLASAAGGRGGPESAAGKPNVPQRRRSTSASTG